MQTLSGRWRLVGVGVVGVATVLGLALLRPALPPGVGPIATSVTAVQVSATAFPTPAAPFSERLATFRQRTTEFLSDPANRAGRIQVLVSFRQGYSVPAAFQELKRLAPEATPVAVMASVDDPTGRRNGGGSFIRDGEDPEEKASNYINGLVETVRRNTATPLDCTRGPECPRIDDPLVYGIQVTTTAAEIERLMASDQTILAVEIVRSSRLLSPIYASTPARY